MTEYSIWPATNGPNTAVVDGTDISRGVRFQLSATGWAKRLRFYRGTTAVVAADTGGAVTGQIYRVSDEQPVPGTLVTFTLSGTGWLEADLDTPVELAANTGYKAVVHSKNYTATGNYFNTGAGVGGIVNGIITAPDAGGNPLGLGGIQQGSFRQPTTGMQYPNQYFQGGNYWVDVVVDDEEPDLDVRDVDGSMVITAPGLTGDAAKTGLTSPTLTVPASELSVLNDKVGLADASVSVSVGLAAASAKTTDQTPSVAITPPVLTGAAQAVGPGVHMPVSAVLCSPWASYVDVPERLRDNVTDFTEEDWTRVLLQASEILWALSGRQWYGEECTETAVLRSFPPGQGSGTWPYHKSWGRCGCWVHATWMDGQPYNIPSNWPHRQQPFAVALPREGINGIVSVEVGGEPFTAFQFLRNGWLERTDGSAWNVCSGDTEITYRWGEAPPYVGKLAAISLAYHLALNEVGSDDCKLPSNVITATRQGLTIQRVDPNDFLDDGRTGISDVDLFLRAFNPYGRPSSGGVWSPDIPASTRTPQ